MPLSPTAIVAKGNALTISSESETRALTGAEKAAVMMLALGDRYGGPIWKLLDEIEIKQLSVAMSKLGPITHVRLNIFPDGGVSRLRLFGKVAK